MNFETRLIIGITILVTIVISWFIFWLAGD